jgi:hypothetical protein
MTIETFDDFLSTDQGPLTNEKPFQFRDDPSSNEKTLEWLNNDFRNLEYRAQSRLRTYRRYISLYKNVQWRMDSPRDNNRIDDTYSERKPRMSVNFVEEMVEAKVSQGTQSKIGFTLIPHNHDEQKDINNAKACKLLLQARCDILDFDIVQQFADRIKYLTGNVFTYVGWDPEIGPLAPGYEKAQLAGVKIPKLDAEGKIIKGKYLDSPVHIGDVCLTNLGPDRVFPEIGKNRWEDVDHAHITYWVHIEELKAEYPTKASQIKENQYNFYYDWDRGELSKPEKFVLVREFWHRKTKWLPEGQYIKYTDDVILERGPHKYNDGEIPLVVDSDIDVYGEIWGRSFISNIEQMQRMYNNIQSGIARDLGVGSAPKWVMPKGSASVNSLNNEFAVIEFTGPQAPQLLSYNPVSEQGIQVQDRLEKKIAQKSAIYDISRGEVPQGVTANSALRFLDEQETRRASPMVAKRKQRILKTLRFMLCRMQQFYKITDGRMIRTLGQQNEYLVKSFEKADFTQIYDVRLQLSSALPDTKTGKISTIVDLNTATQTDPIFKREDIVQMLDLGTDEAFVDNAVVALTAARTLLDKMLDGEAVPEPQPYENLLIHYDVFTRYMETTGYKTMVSEEIKSAIQTRILTIEGLMYQKAKQNLLFLQKLMLEDKFPIYYIPEMPLYQLSMMMQAPPAPIGPQQSGVDSSKIKNMTQTNQGEI